MNKKDYYSSGEITKELNISLRQLYYWELKGLIKPEKYKLGVREFKKYSTRDYEILKKMKYYLDQGYTFAFAARYAKQEK